MKTYGYGHRFSENPIGSDAPRGKRRYRRKSARDGKELTPTEQHHKNELMRQFLQRDGSQGNSAAYLANYDAIDWSA